MSLAPAFLAPAPRLSRKDVNKFLMRLLPGTVLRCTVNEYAPEVVGGLFAVTRTTGGTIYMIDNDHARRLARLPEAPSDFDLVTNTTLGYRINGPYKIVWEIVPFS